MQKKCAVILCEKKSAASSRKSLAEAEILFTPIIDTVMNTVFDSGIGDSFILKSAEERTEKFRNFIAHNRGGDMLVVDGTSVFLDSKTVMDAYNDFEQRERETTLIVSDGSWKTVGIWLTVENFRKHCAINSQNALELNDITNAFENAEKFFCKNEDVALSINDCKDLYEVNEYARKKVIEKHMKNGVVFPCTDGTIISEKAVIKCDTVILPGTIIKGETVIGECCEIGPDSLVENSSIGDNTVFNSSQCYNSKIGSGTEIGPYVRVRPNCIVGDNVRVGNFVELKNSNVDDEAKISHLSYIGDSDVGKDVNIGCGCATVNFDGVNKHRTKISDGSFIGCGVNLVAPVTVGVDAFVAAGSTIVEDVPDSALAIARNKQYVKNEWVKEKKPYRRMRK